MASISTDLSTNLVSVWLTDSSGLTTDLHGSNDLTNTGVVLATGNQGDAGDFEQGDGSDKLVITDAAQSGLDITGDLTIACWVNPESFTANAVLVGKGAAIGSVGGYDLLLLTTGAVVGDAWQTNTTQSRAITSGTISLSTWTHIAMVYTASTKQVDIYFNGSNQALSTDTQNSASIANTTDPFIMGNNNGNGNLYDGLINQVCVWNAALSGANISTLYNSGTGIPYAPAASNHFLSLLGIGA